MDTDKNEIFSHFKSVLDNLIDHSVFYKTFLQAPHYLDYNVYGGSYGIPANITLATGVTRACIIDNNYDWVVKFDSEEDGYGSACEREEYTYTKACEKGLKNYFCEVKFIGYYEREFRFFSTNKIFQYLNLNEYSQSGEYEKYFYKNHNDFGEIVNITIKIPLYAYRRIDEENYYNLSSEVTKEEKKTLSNYNSPLVEKNLSVGVEFLRAYGETEYFRITDFLYEYNINDIHCGNIGYINGNFIIIDYAGYYEGEDSEEWN